MSIYVSYNWEDQNINELRRVLAFIEDMESKGLSILSRMGSHEETKDYIKRCIE
jgi:hypothetical protein